MSEHWHDSLPCLNKRLADTRDFYARMLGLDPSDVSVRGFKKGEDPKHSGRSFVSVRAAGRYFNSIEH